MPPEQIPLHSLRVAVRPRLLRQRLGRTLAVPAAPAPTGSGVDQHAPRVRLDRLDAAMPQPGQIGLGQRGLEEILRAGPVAGEQVRGAQQRGRTRRDELAELLLQARYRRHSTALSPDRRAAASLSQPPRGRQPPTTPPAAAPLPRRRRPSGPQPPPARTTPPLRAGSARPVWAAAPPRVAPGPARRTPARTCRS